MPENFLNRRHPRHPPCHLWRNCKRWTAIAKLGGALHGVSQDGWKLQS